VPCAAQRTASCPIGAPCRLCNSLPYLGQTKYRNHRSNDDQRAPKTGYYGMTSSRNGPARYGAGAVR
jgi:hypothetical protein